MLTTIKNLLNFNTRQIHRLKAIVSKVRTFVPAVEAMSDADFPARTKALREIVGGDASKLDSVLPEAFALVREAAHRTLGQKHFDTQLIAAIALHEGHIAEQKTGEGKTLTATLALYLNALTGNGAHLVTVNDYLARRDAGWMGQVFHFLGMSTSAMISEASFIFDPTYEGGGSADDRLAKLRPVSRAEAYQADIAYGINSEFGFDYLRDNMADDPSRLVQRGFHFAIVDEADSVLIDEARTPHIISAPVEREVSRYYEYAKLVKRLDAATDYLIDEKQRTVHLTDAGVVHIESMLGVSNLYEKDYETLFYVEAALKAETLFKLDKDYIVQAGEVVIVDEFTGRLLEGRRFSEGLHQAIEAKENVSIKRESRTLATVSLQNYFRMYKKLSGMTGTAATEAEEFNKIYHTDVLIIPTHRPIGRKDLPDMIYKTEKGKYEAVADEIAKQHAIGRPVLVGTTSIEKNEHLSKLLHKRGIPHEMLNAKNHEREAAIISKAGERGAVTVATNMAGRGVDIILGGADKGMHDEVVALGGLAVIGTERHESRRIDNQLRGRAGRQGDPGSSQFFVSLEDDMMRIFGGEQISRLMTYFNFPEDQPLSHSMVNKALESAQQKVEGHNFDIRKHLVEYDDVLNKQREIIYGLRRKMLEALSRDSKDIQKTVDDKLLLILRQMIGSTLAIGEQDEQSATRSEFDKDMTVLFGLDESYVTDIISKGDLISIEKDLGDAVLEVVRKKAAGVPHEVWLSVVRSIFLSTIDQFWTLHLTSIDELRDGINLRGFAQMDPLIEYKNEAFTMFEKLVADIDYEVVKRLMSVEIRPEIEEAVRATPTKPKQLIMHAASGTNSYEQAQSAKGIVQNPSNTSAPTTQMVNEYKGVGRNDPCPCGSGKKYKKCHGA
ncbi:MAG: preprotein translocase subunit SecA [bacterium]